MQGTIFSSKNLKLFGVCAVLLTIGYILLGQGPVENPLSKTIAPVVLIVVYCVLIPYAILAKSKDESGNKDNQQQKKSGV
jgi:hypothetical protein